MKIFSIKKLITLILILSFFIGCKTQPEKPLLEKLEKKEETFLINTQRDTILEGKEGTLIYLEKESFHDSGFNLITDSIQISLVELYQTKDIISQSISMLAGEKILETGGMINLSARSNGKDLQLTKDVVVHFPKNKNEENMNLFYGISDSTGIMEWEIEEASTYRLQNRIQAWYTKYDFIDDTRLRLINGKSYIDTAHQHFNFSEKEIEELLNKTVDAKYILFYDSEMYFTKIEGSKISRKLRRKIKNRVKDFPKCKPYTINGESIDMEGFFKIWTEVIPPKYKSKENYLKSIEKKLSDSNEKKSSIELAELQYYIFDSRNLGWMNCDRFINSNAKKTDLIVKVPKSKNVFVKIIFKNYKTVMTGIEKRKKFIFKNLPIGEPIKIVVLDEKKGTPRLQIVDTSVSKESIEIKNLTEYSLEELQEKLRELN